MLSNVLDFLTRDASKSDTVNLLCKRYKDAELPKNININNLTPEESKNLSSVIAKRLEYLIKDLYDLGLFTSVYSSDKANISLAKNAEPVNIVDTDNKLAINDLEGREYCIITKNMNKNIFKFDKDNNRLIIEDHKSISHIMIGKKKSIEEISDIRKKRSIQEVSDKNEESLKQSRRIQFTDETIREAVELWFDDREQAMQQHGHINSWDVSLVTDMDELFIGQKFTDEDLSNWDVSNVISMNGTFSESNFNGDISNWNVSKVKYMSEMFSNSPFNNDISGWNIESLIDASLMFYQNLVFNQPIGSWNTSNLRNINGMFSYAYEFNQPLNSWNVENIEGMSFCFCNAKNFNQPLNSWKTNKLQSTYQMFINAKRFNQDISSWDFSKNRSFEEMFWEAFSFNQNCDSWNINTNVSLNLKNMFFKSGMENLPLWYKKEIEEVPKKGMDAFAIEDNSDDENDNNPVEKKDQSTQVDAILDSSLKIIKLSDCKISNDDLSLGKIDPVAAWTCQTSVNFADLTDENPFNSIEEFLKKN